MVPVGSGDHQQSIRKVMGAVDERRSASTKLVEEARVKWPTKEWVNEVDRINGEIGKQLATVILEATKDVGKRGELAENLKSYRKPSSVDEVYQALARRIKEDCREDEVQMLATEIARSLHKEYDLPKKIVSPVYELYSVLEKGMNDTLIEVTEQEAIQMQILLGHCRHIAHRIFEWVESNIDYINDPPDEYFRPSRLTLALRGGDCDDHAILICSLLRSIGFKTFLKLEPEHVFGGVVLAKLVEKPKKYQAEQILVPLDPGKPKPILDLAGKIPEEDLEEYLDLEGRIPRLVFDAFDVAFDTAKVNTLFQLAREVESAPKNSSTELEQVKQDVLSVASRIKEWKHDIQTLERRVFYLDTNSARRPPEDLLGD